MFETLGEKAEEKAMVQFLERFTDYPFLIKFKNSEYPIGCLLYTSDAADEL